MIKSMTGFGKAFLEKGSKRYVAEINSLNSKNLDLKLRFPSAFREKEIELRKEISQSLNRGKVEYSLTVEDLSGKTSAKIDAATFKNYFNTLNNLGSELNAKSDFFSLALKMPDVIKTERQEMSGDEWEIILQVTKEACNQLNVFRTEEGKRLEVDIVSHVKNILAFQEEIPQFEKERIENVKTRINSSLESLSQNKELDKSRFEQEMIYYLEKLDINEEMVRLKSHCTYFQEAISKEEFQGKKLGFISQEMGREINTLGSKANHSEIQKIVVRMKDELEKIKEQTLNIL